jgi:hypothetical protein
VSGSIPYAAGPRPARAPFRGIETLSCSAALLAITCLLAPALARAGGNAPGSYCPFPEKGQRPQCLTGAEERYSNFYRGLDAGSVDSADAARLEADLVGRDAAHTFEALSSLAYGYYVLARRAAESPTADPVLVARLERWNEVLAKAYHDTPPDTAFRSAVLEAAQDLHRRAAPVELSCRDAAGREAPCTSTDALLHGMDEVRDHTGLRGQLGRLMERLFGGDGS